MARSWRSALLLLLCGVVLAGWLITSGSVALGVAELVIFSVLAVLFSPLVFPQPVSAAEASRRHTSEGRPIIYWRPGCKFCLRLRFRLAGVAHRASWVNIWSDPEGAGAVRAIADGNETVPTVVAGGEQIVNPPPHWVRDRLSAA